MVRGFERALGRCGALLLALIGGGCDTQLGVGKWNCTTEPGPAGPHDGGTTYPLTDPIAMPWSTSFEDGFCSYGGVGGYCYTNNPNGGVATIELDTSLAHSGYRSLKFLVNTTDNSRYQMQARCVREGALPTDAVYGAWYYVPALATNDGNWNLMHFQGGDGSTSWHNLWDVSLENSDTGGLYLLVRDLLHSDPLPEPTIVDIPIGAWFHIEFHLRRAADDTGVVELFNNGRRLLRVTGISTDDSSIGQWYVGSLANALSPSDASVYVDDVSIRASP